MLTSEHCAHKTETKELRARGRYVCMLLYVKHVMYEDVHVCVLCDMRLCCTRDYLSLFDYSDEVLWQPIDDMKTLSILPTTWRWEHLPQASHHRAGVCEGGNHNTGGLARKPFLRQPTGTETCTMLRVRKRGDDWVPCLEKESFFKSDSGKKPVSSIKTTAFET